MNSRRFMGFPESQRSRTTYNTSGACIAAKATPHVRFGSKADKLDLIIDVRFTPESGHRELASICPLCAKSGHNAVQQNASLFDHLVGSHAHCVFRG